MDEADLVVRNARVTTLHGNSPEAEAFAVRGEKFVAVGDEAEVMPLTQAAPEVPVLVLYAYSQVLVNRAGVAALSLSPGQAPADGGRYEFADEGLIVRGNTAVYATIGRLPGLASIGDRLSSTRYFFRELNRFGLTSIVDAGASGVTYPEDYQAAADLAAQPGFPVRLSTFLFAQKPGAELESWETWTAQEQRDLNRAVARLDGFVLEGAGEVLAWSVHDYENFLAPRPELTGQAISELTEVTRVIASHQWPIRIHATYDETISRILDVFQQVFAETGYTSRWAIDHAETITPRNIARIKAMGGGIAVQNRLSFSGEFFAERYGQRAAASAQPLRALVDAGIPVGAGTDATRPASYNPWISLFWMVTGKTVGGTQITSRDSRLSREEALRLYTAGSAWFSGEEHVKGRIAPGQYADFALLSADYLSVPDEQITAIESVLTVTGGDVAYAAAPFEAFSPAPMSTSTSCRPSTPRRWLAMAVIRRGAPLLSGHRRARSTSWTPSRSRPGSCRSARPASWAGPRPNGGRWRVASTNTPQTWSPTGPTGSAASRRCPFLTSAAPLRNSGMRWTHCTPTE